MYFSAKEVNCPSLSPSAVEGGDFPPAEIKPIFLIIKNNFQELESATPFP